MTQKTIEINQLNKQEFEQLKQELKQIGLVLQKHYENLGTHYIVIEPVM